jgi:hypothetical protein
MSSPSNLLSVARVVAFVGGLFYGHKRSGDLQVLEDKLALDWAAKNPQKAQAFLAAMSGDSHHAHADSHAAPAESHGHH